MSRVIVHVYDCGHPDPYVEPRSDTTVADQLAALAHHVPLAPASTTLPSQAPA